MLTSVANPLDKAIEWVSPGWASKRLFERVRIEHARAFYDGATTGRRSASLRRKRGDANTITQATLLNLREHVRDLARNNAHAKRAIEAITANTIGVGIQPHFLRKGKRAQDIHDLALASLVNSTEIDVEGRSNIFGLQSLAMDATARDGEVLVRRRWRKLSDGLAVPVQFQVLEADYVDDQRNEDLRGGGRIIQGVEYDAIGRRRGYWLFKDHPGSRRVTSTASRFIPAEDIAHMYRVERPGQVRGIPWGSSVVLAHADFHDYEDAQRVRQKIAACFAIFITESFESGLPGSTRQNTDGELIDELEPGLIERLLPGQEINFANPPAVSGYGEYASVTLHKIAMGWGVSYEAMTGDLRGVNFSSGKMGRLEFDRNTSRWQTLMVVPSLCDPMMKWWMEAAALTGAAVDDVVVRHQPPARAMIDPTRESKAERDEIRAGQKTWSQSIRERGSDPQEHFEEYAADVQRLDDLEIVLDSDVRNDKAQQAPQPVVDPNAPPPDPNADPAQEDLTAAMDRLLEMLESRGHEVNHNGKGRS